MNLRTLVSDQIVLFPQLGNRKNLVSLSIHSKPGASAPRGTDHRGMLDTIAILKTRRTTPAFGNSQDIYHLDKLVSLPNRKGVVCPSGFFLPAFSMAV